MTTMSDPGTFQAGPTGGESTSRMLRRSKTDRIISGVSGGLGQYFGVDPVIFRVLFAVLSFFGGVGLLAYGLAWVLIPEPEVDRSVLDKALHELRVRRVPPWVVIVGGAVVVWLGWFSWWAPRALPAVLLLAAVALVLMRRVGRGASALAADTQTAGATGEHTGIGPENTVGSEDGAVPAEDAAVPNPVGWHPPPVAGQPMAAGVTAPLIPPLNDTRRSMQAWLTEAGQAHQERMRRRRPVKIAVGLGLLVGWGFVAMMDAFTRVPFPAYLWVGLAILGAGLVISIVTRRMMLSLLIPILALAVIALGLGGTRASLSDGSGRIGWMPTSQSQLTTYRQFAGASTLDLTALDTLHSPASVQITQAAGAVFIRVPASMRATVIADVHMGDIQNGTSTAAGQFQAGLNVHLQLDPPSTASGQPVTIHVVLATGRVQVDRIS